jgi:hypothetical protein
MNGVKKVGGNDAAKVPQLILNVLDNDTLTGAKDARERP